jgi:hypothetical protein
MVVLVRATLFHLLMALAVLLYVPAPVAAAPLDDALARLAADSFPETEKAIAGIAASGACSSAPRTKAST